ncbi:ligand-effect modulator 3 family [Scheffersomyces amazonensis]|uniref:ligand-effect modulator 3 family n=1 Tax=Scheffersomyces amazonensis TaxID=1078765 RepID=UPI00315D1535
MAIDARDNIGNAGNAEAAPQAQSNYPNAPDSDYESDSSSQDSSLGKKDKEKTRRPGDNAFRQQRLKAVNPVFTAKTVIPLLIGIAIVFVPLGAAMWYASHSIQDLVIDYSQCENLASSDYWLPIPENYTSFHFGSYSNQTKAVWKLDTDESQIFEDQRLVCRVQFEIPKKLNAPIYFFYRLNNFHANHRRYVKSFSEDQIQGKAASLNDIKNTVGQNCQPLSTDENGNRIYPCGLIANSLFNDTFSTTLTAVNGTLNNYNLTDQGIAWATDKNRFKKTAYNYTEVVPPPNWYKSYPNGYNETNFPDISTWYQFQNWMHASALPNFNKLALRNDHDTLQPGTYELSIGLHFPVLPYNGNKYIYITQRSVIGGKNIFLGVSWMIGGAICFAIGLILLIVNFIHPRKTGDVNLLSWNKEKFAQDEKEELSSDSAIATGVEKLDQHQ